METRITGFTFGKTVTPKIKVRKLSGIIPQKKSVGEVQINKKLLTEMRGNRKLATVENLRGGQVENSAKNSPYGYSGGCCRVPLTESCPW